MNRGILIICTVFTLCLLFSPAYALEQQPWLEQPGTQATYMADFHLPDFGVGQFTRTRWEVIDHYTTPDGAVTKFYFEIGSAADYYDVPHVTGLAPIYVPREAFRGAIETELQVEGIGKVPVYQVQVNWEGLSGTVYYEKTSLIAIRGDLAGSFNGDEAWYRFWLQSASPGLVHTVAETPAYTPTPTPKATVAGLDPMMFYTLIIVLAILIVGVVIVFSIRRRPHGYPPPPPPPP